MTTYNKIGIKEVATHAGVAISTVSRVINNGQVSAKTRAKVEKAIINLGYQPEKRGMDLRKGSTKKVGIIIPDISNPAYSVTVKVMHDHLREAGYCVLLGTTFKSVEEELKLLQTMSDEYVDGIILHTSEGDEDPRKFERFWKSLHQRCPLVFIGKHQRDLPIDMITSNNEGGVEKLVNYFIRTGRKKFVFISGDANNMASRERLAGFNKALDAHSLDSVATLTGGDFSIEMGSRWINALLEEDSALGNIDAIVCANDLLAVGVLYALEEAGISVPSQIAVGGYDDIELATLVRPRLTTIHQPFEVIAQKAAEVIIARLKGEGGPISRIVLEPELVVRSSG